MRTLRRRSCCCCPNHNPRTLTMTLTLHPPPSTLHPPPSPSSTPRRHAIVIGAIGGFVYIGGSRLELRLKIDDPLDAFAVHGCCGFWGCIATALFSVPDYAWGAGGGLFYGEGKQLGLTVLVLLAEISWTSLIAGTMFLLLKKGKVLRITNAVEDVGMDLCKTGGSAYSFEGNGDPALGNGRPARSGQVGVSMPPHRVQPVDEPGGPTSLFSH